jgi:anti-sigma factor RsiW
MTAHLGEEDLILHHYGESQDPAAERAHLAACSECRANYDGLERTLAAVSSSEVPERPAEYGRTVWWRLQPRLRASRSRTAVWSGRLVPFAALAASLVLAFLLGRVTRERELLIAQPINEPARERILLVAVGEHLERSQMVLVELQNAGGSESVDISTERHWAEELVPANRLYRQAALRAGEPGVANVLDELERVLVEIANSPDRLGTPGLEQIKQRIEAQGILFKVRVIGSQVREREQTRETKGNWSQS